MEIGLKKPRKLTMLIAALIFGLFVPLGAFIVSGRVVNTVNTISGGIVSQDCISTTVSLVILLSAALSLFIANMGIGSANSGHKFIMTHQMVRKILRLWVVSPLISLVVTYLLLAMIN